MQHNTTGNGEKTAQPLWVPRWRKGITSYKARCTGPRGAAGLEARVMCSLWAVLNRRCLGMPVKMDKGKSLGSNECVFVVGGGAS